MRITALTAADAAKYRELMLHAYKHAADAFTSTPQERAREPQSWWINRVADPSGLTASFGAFNATAMVGTVALEYSAKPKTAHKALLIGMYVLPPYRRHGLGRSLMQAAIQHGRDRAGVEVIQLDVTQGNEAATQLYESFGFHAFGLEPMALRAASGYLSKVHMWLHLANGENAAENAA